MTSIETALRDVTYALRSLRRQPAYSITAIATLAAGIGAGTTVFAFVSAVLLRPLPFDRPGELVRIYETNPTRHWTRELAAPANYADWRRLNRALEGIGAYEQFNSNGSGANDVFLTGSGEPQALKALGVSGNLLDVLGTRPLMGRTFTDDETFEGRSRVAILSFAAWQGVFGGDPAIVGRTITLSGGTYDVVGVMPRDFFFPGRDVQLWLPFGYPVDLIARSRRPHWLGVVGRLRPSISLRQAQADLTSVARQLEAQYPDTNTQMGVLLEPLHATLAREPRTALLVLSGAVALLFLLVCANIANLQLARAAGRSRELAIRRALGAARARLVRQLLTESFVVSAAGGALGLAIAALAWEGLTELAAPALPLFTDVRLDRAVAASAAALSILAPALFGVVPALTASGSDHLSERHESGGRQTRFLRSVLVAAEVGLSVVLVVGAVLMLRSFRRLSEVDPGFTHDHAVAFTLALPVARYPNATTRIRAINELERGIGTEPDVQAVGATSTLPLRGYTWTGDATVEGRAAGEYEHELRHSSVTRSYFATMDVPLIAGRMIAETDTADRPPVALINQALASRYFKDANPVGKRLKFGRPQDDIPWVTVVGVVRDLKQDGLDRPPEPEAYSPMTERVSNPVTFVVRSASSPEAMVNAARRQVWSVDKDLALTRVTTLDAIVSDAAGPQRFRTSLLSAFASLALVLAGLGIYGVLAYTVSQRSRELGIRIALGARPSELFRLVVGQGMVPVAGGAVAGLAAALSMTRLIQTLLFGVQALDPATYAMAIGLLGLVALSACAVPAWQAIRVDPLAAIRDE